MLKGTVKEKCKELYMMSLSREIDLKLCQNLHKYDFTYPRLHFYHGSLTSKIFNYLV